MVTNCLSIDVESFTESKLERLALNKHHIDWNQQNREILENTHSVLSLLEELEIKATFFFLGRIARDAPEVVRAVAQRGHEIACHGFEHLRIFDTSPKKFTEDLKASKYLLEEVSQQAVYGFRAPEFSITSASIWALDVIRESGFLYDSSIFPISIHDVCGIPNANRFIHKLENGLIEFPLATIKFFNFNLPFGGGSYFRLYPLALTKYCITRFNKSSQPCMIYFHPYEVGTVLPRLTSISTYNKLRHYINCHKGETRLKALSAKFNFAPALEILKEKGFIDSPSAH